MGVECKCMHVITIFQMPNGLLYYTSLSLSVDIDISDSNL